MARDAGDRERSVTAGAGCMRTRAATMQIGKDEGPAASPRPKAGAQVGDVDAHLNGERPRSGDIPQWPPHLLLTASAVANKFSLHLADERHGTAEPKQPQAQEIKRHLANSALRNGSRYRHL
jgi:hypothetical protein